MKFLRRLVILADLLISFFFFVILTAFLISKFFLVLTHLSLGTAHFYSRWTQNSFSPNSSPLHFYPSLSRETPPTPFPSSDWSDNQMVFLSLADQFKKYSEISLNFRGRKTARTKPKVADLFREINHTFRKLYAEQNFQISSLRTSFKLRPGGQG